MTRLLITGATGGLGRNATEYARQKGARLTLTGRNKAVLDAMQSDTTTTVACDLTQASSESIATLVHGHDAVWHCAALSSPWGSYADFQTNNVLLSERLFLAAALARVPVFVHISTPALYFDFHHRYAVSEAQVAHTPVNHYAATKAQAEKQLQALAAQHPHTRLVILRPRAIFGPYDQVLFPRLLRLIQDGKGKITLPRAGATLLDLTYAENVAHAMWLATHTLCESGRAFNITNGDPITVRDALTTLIQAHLGQPLAIRSVPYPVMAALAYFQEQMACLTGAEPKYTRYSIGALAYDMTLDISAARQYLNYSPVVSVTEGLAKTAAWLQHHG